MVTEREKHLEILRKMFTKDINYKFDGSEAVPFETFLKKVLSNAERKYSDDFYWRKYPEFENFLYSFKVDSIAHAVYIGDLD